MSKMIAIIAAIVVVAAGAGVLVYGNMDLGDKKDEPTSVDNTDVNDENNDGDGEKTEDGPVAIELKDSNNVSKTYNFDKPLTKICVVNSNCMEWIQILGMENMVVAGCELALKEETLNGDLFKNAKNVGATASASVEAIVESEAQLVINPTKSGLADAKIAELNDVYGIPTITLACNGESMMQDVEALLKIANSTTANTKFEGYKADCDAVHAKVMEAVKDATAKRAIMSTVNSSKIKFYLPTSELGKILTSLKVDNPIQPTDKSTVYATYSDETVTDLDGEKSFDFILVRTMSSYDLPKVFDKNKDYFGEAYANMQCVKDRHVYSFESDVTSGAMTYIGEVLLCHLLGIEIDLHAGDLVDQFLEKYGFNGSYENLAYDGETYYGFRA